MGNARIFIDNILIAISSSFVAHKNYLPLTPVEPVKIVFY